MKEVKFTIEGFRPGYPSSCKRGIKIKVPEDVKQEDFLKMYEEALVTLLRHEAIVLEESAKILENRSD